VRARLSRVTPKSAVATVVTAQVGQWKKNFARVRDGSRLESFLGCDRRRQKPWKIRVGAANQPARRLAGQRLIKKLPWSLDSICDSGRQFQNLG